MSFHSIRWKYLSIFVIAGILCSLFISLYWLPESERELKNEYRKLVKIQLETLGEGLLPFMLQNQYAAVYETLDTHKEKHKNWIGLVFKRADGTQIYPISHTDLYSKENEIYVEENILFRGMPFGQISATVDLSEYLKNEGTRHSQLFEAMLLMLLVVGIIVAIHLELFVVRPVQELEMAANQIAEGQYDISTFIDQNDEIGRLGQRFAHMSQQLKQGEIRALEADRAKNSFLSTMSHEIRTPLNGVIAIAHLLEETELNDVQRDYLETIISSSDLLLAIINDVLDYSKIADGKLELDQSPFLLKECHTTTSRLLEKLALNKGIEFTFENTIDDGVCVLGDKYRLSQVFLNLINNSIKFTDNGFVKARLTGKIQDGMCTLFFEVKDSGIGISKENLPKLFMRFQQEDTSTTRKFGGTGLGLSICKSIIGYMGSSIQVESEKGVGSSFSFKIQLPVCEAELPVSRDKSGPMTPSCHGLNILLTEDNKINQKVACTILKKCGHKTTLANNGAEAVEHSKKQKFDLILMDIQMPVMDGLTATKLILQPDNPNFETTILALSADVSTSTIIEAKKLGVRGHISKPFKPNDLKMTLERFFPDC